MLRFVTDKCTIGVRREPTFAMGESLPTPFVWKAIDLGVPERCPTCRCPVWEFNGALPEGITRVVCPSCGRTYVRMDLYEQLRWTASMLAGYAINRNRMGCLPWYTRVVDLMYKIDGATGREVTMVVTVEGCPDDGGDDEAPF